MEKQVQKESKLIWILKSLLAAYLVTGILLVLLTFLLYQFELDEQKVTAGIVVIYVVSTFVGGLIRKAYKSKSICMGLDAWGCLFCIAAFDIAWDIQGD